MHENEIYSREELEAFLEGSLDDIYLALGEDLSSILPLAIEPTEEQLIATGKRWMLGKTKEFCEALSKSEVIRGYVLKGVLYDRLEVVSIVADILVSLGIGVSAITPALIIVRQGILELCKPQGFFNDKL